MVLEVSVICPITSHLMLFLVNNSNISSLAWPSTIIIKESIDTPSASISRASNISSTDGSIKFLILA